MTLTSRIRGVWLGAALLLPVPLALAAVKKPQPETPWQVAEAARGQLASIPANERTAADYRTVMDAYRLIYHTSPSDLHAPESILIVGNLLAEEGVVLHDQRALQASLGQYEFLRKNYPTSSLRIAALLEEAHVAAAGLHDVKLAREKYAAFADQFPRSQHIDEVHQALITLHTGALPAVTSGPLASVQADSATSGAGAQPSGPSEKNLAPPPPSALAKDTETGHIADAGKLQRSAAAASNGVAGNSVAPGERAEASTLASERKASPSDTAQQARANADRETAPAQGTTGPTHTRSGLALVSGIRHWSTPTYTRVAIDLGDEVKYEAARVPRPDRIFFDLHGTRLSPELTGKTFQVVDDGFLKRIRAAQFSNDTTRVVLDVNDVTEYSAFLLPNPYRLIIDIHGGGKKKATADPPEENNLPTQSADAAVVGDPIAAAPSTPRTAENHTADTRTPESVEAAVAAKARTEATAPQKSADSSYRVPLPTASVVPSAVAVRSSGSAHEVATLGQQPDKIEATEKPTSQPIAVVADRSGTASSDASSAPRRTRRGRDPLAADVSMQRTANPTTAGQRSLMRALGLKIGRIVIDPGHGGHDSGTLGAGGIMEKDVVLDVALRLGKLLHDHLGAEIIYTRSDDTFIPLETRTAIANKAEADLFLSIHANSSQDASARGVETYYLNFTSQPDALDVAARENAVSDQSVHELADMVKKITLKDKIDESREFAQDVEASLYDGLQRGNGGLKNRGVKKAPFVVLIGANMPSVLTEISFVTNPQDAAQLRTGAYRQRIAESIYRGVSRYAQGLGGMRIASSGASTARKDVQ